MQGVRQAVRIAAGLTCALALLMLLVAAVHPGRLPGLPLQTKDGSPLAVPVAAGVSEARWAGKPVLVFVVPASSLAGVAALRGEDAPTPSIAHPQDPALRIFVLSATSTHMGCTVRWTASLGASRDIADYDGDGRADGRIIDPCHQGQWDAYHHGEPVVGPTCGRRLAALNVSYADGRLLADSFDGPVGPPAAC